MSINRTAPTNVRGQLAIMPNDGAKKPRRPPKFVSFKHSVVGDSIAPTKVEIRVPLRLVSESNSRDHWRKKYERALEQKTVILLALRRCSRKLSVASRYCIKITRFGMNKLDGDNLQRSAKAVRDAIAKHIGIDDGSDRLTWQYDQVVGGPYGVSVSIEAVG